MILTHIYFDGTEFTLLQHIPIKVRNRVRQTSDVKFCENNAEFIKYTLIKVFNVLFCSFNTVACKGFESH